MWEIKQLVKYSEDGFESMDDNIVIEEPLQIMIQKPCQLPEPLSITMRTPGDDEALALGFMYGEGMIVNNNEAEAIAVSPETVVVKVPASFQMAREDKRNFYMTSSCGVCGKSSIESLKIHKDPFNISEEIVPSIIPGLYREMLQTQMAYTLTGGCHSAGVFTLDGHLVSASEDVGRHNALDKCVGKMLRAHFDMDTPVIVCLSGRACYELIQKAAMIHAVCVISVGAPTTLAIETADEMGITLIRFFKKLSFNVFTHSARIVVR